MNNVILLFIILLLLFIVNNIIDKKNKISYYNIFKLSFIISIISWYIYNKDKDIELDLNIAPF